MDALFTFAMIFAIIFACMLVAKFALAVWYYVLIARDDRRARERERVRAQARNVYTPALGEADDAMGAYARAAERAARGSEE